MLRPKFIKAVDNNDIISVRLFLAGELLLDPRGSSFQEMLSYAEAHFTDLYQEDDEKEYSVDENDWNDDFLYMLKNDLDFNFSSKKLDLYRKVARYVLKDKIKVLDEEDRKQASQSASGTYSHENSCDGVTRKQLYTGITIAGAAVTVAGLCISKAAITTLGIAGLIIGGGLILNEKRK